MQRQRLRRGQTLIAFALFTAVLFGFLGLLFDGGRLYFGRRLAQSAADSAAFGAAHEIYRRNSDYVVEAGLSDARLNGFDDDASDVKVDVRWPPTTGPRTGDVSFVEVVVTEEYPTTFMRLFGPGSSTVTGRGVAGLVDDWDLPCVLAKNPTAAGALTVSGTGSLLAPGCPVMVNSNSPAAITTNGGGCVNASQIGFVLPGSYLGNGGACVSPLPEGNAIPAPDPYSYLQEPNPADYPLRSGSRLTITNATAAALSPLQPGYYRGGIRMTDGTLTFAPGLYIIDGMEISGNSIITGDGVTFFNTGAGLRNIVITGTVEADLSAPLSGDWENILFFNSRSIPKNSTTAIQIIGTSNSVFEGVHYFPTVHVEYAGNSGSGPEWAMLIADTIEITGTPDLTITYDGSGGRKPTTRKVALVE